MRRAKTDLTMIHLQNQILAKFGPEKLAAAKDRLCRVCVFRELHGRPCPLLPLTLEGKDCPYHAAGNPGRKGGNHNGRP